ncbi:MAG TPA: HepT-like ribonuclease domain-containing protein [Thermoanaerobaculia bacterium]|jgi:uncharacterized protein with HEPN domain|nr:HepT-like ribonuclease domain-containing protein [Thermoanaerobaculia bacterium]
MPRRDTSVSLRQMLDYAREALEMVRSQVRSDLDTDRKLNLALVRLLEILGEAANRISPEERSKYSQIPWSQLISLRNRLIHGYDQVDFDILWQIVTRDLPALESELEKIVPTPGLA